MTKEEIRQKAIECVKEMKDECADIKCESENCAKYEDCTYLVDTLYHDAFTIWAYEHGFSDGVEEGKRMASEKQTPKKPIPYRYQYIYKGKEEEQLNFRCPVCSKNKDIDFWDSFVTIGKRRCSRCDTLLDWTEGEEE